MNSIILSNITYRYPLTDFDALHDVSFCFEEGKFYGVIGPNGAGKTTLCSLVKGLIPGFFQGELTGDVQILGKRMESWDESELTSRVGYIFQNPFTQISGVKDTVFEEIAIGLENLRMPKEEIIARVVDIVRLIGIEDLIELNCPAGSASVWPSPRYLPWTVISMLSTSPLPSWTRMARKRCSKLFPP